MNPSNGKASWVAAKQGGNPPHPAENFQRPPPRMSSQPNSQGPHQATRAAPIPIERPQPFQSNISSTARPARTAEDHRVQSGNLSSKDFHNMPQTEQQALRAQYDAQKQQVSSIRVNESIRKRAELGSSQVNQASQGLMSHHNAHRNPSKLNQSFVPPPATSTQVRAIQIKREPSLQEFKYPSTPRREHVKPVPSAPTKQDYNSISLQDEDEYDGEFADLKAVPDFEDVLNGTYLDQDSLFNLKDGKPRESDVLAGNPATKRQKSSKPLPNFVIPDHMLNLGNVNRGLDLRKIWEERKEVAKALELSNPNWLVVSALAQDQSDRIKETQSRHASLMQDFDYLINVKNETLHAKQNITIQYADAGSRLSEDCVDIQHSTRRMPFGRESSRAPSVVRG